MRYLVHIRLLILCCYIGGGISDIAAAEDGKSDAFLSDGLSARIYDDLTFSELKARRIDKVIDFDWDLEGPAGGIDPDTFVVAWDGSIMAPETGEYTFFVKSDDGIRLYVNNILLVDQWHDMHDEEHAGKMKLYAGESYPIKLEYYDNKKYALVSLQWQGPGIEKQVIPTANLSSKQVAEKIDDIWVVDLDTLSYSEKILTLTLQGLVSKYKTAIWVKEAGLCELIRKRLEIKGIRFHDGSSPYDLIEKFSEYIDGYVLCGQDVKSMNAAISICGAKNAVAVQERLADKVERLTRLRQVADVRGYDANRTMSEYRDLFGHELVMEQKSTDYLVDLAVARNAFTFSGVDQNTRQRFVDSLTSQGLVMGWTTNGGEYEWITDLSTVNASGIAADWARNLSVLSRIPSEIPSPPKKYPDPVQEGERIVAFVMSDGDNMQFMAGDFIKNKNYFGSAYRGQFCMNWEFPPMMAEFDAPGVREFYELASRGYTTDCFIAGPSGYGYAFHHLLPRRADFAADTGFEMAKCKLNVVTVLNINDGQMSEVDELLDRKEIMGAIYKDYSPYNRRNGEIYWHNDKPAVSYKFLLWDDLGDWDSMIKGVLKMPSSPATDQGSYAFVNVHAWSFSDIGGPMAAIKKTIDMLPENTRVVTAEELIILLRNNFGKPITAEEYYRE